MRIMIDANIIVSAILFPNSNIAKAIDHIGNNFDLIISKYTLEEVEDVFNEKFPHKLSEMYEFMKQVPYELFVLEKIENKKYPSIRDDEDLPVLANAIESKVDILITGDKDFDNVKIEIPRIMKPREHIDEYMVG